MNELILSYPDVVAIRCAGLSRKPVHDLHGGESSQRGLAWWQVRSHVEGQETGDHMS
jgi:hypothetical protein